MKFNVINANCHIGLRKESLMNKMLVSSNERFEAVRFMGQKEVFGSTVKKLNMAFEYSITFPGRRFGLNIGDWVLRSINHTDIYNSDMYFAIPDKYFRLMYSEVK